MTSPVARATAAVAVLVALGACAPAPSTPAVGATSASATPRPTLADPVAAAEALARELHPPGASALPSGRTDYRRPGDVGADLELLVSRRPDVVRPLVLPHRTPLGAPVTGVELGRADDFAPVFVLLGGHHAGEWPSVDVVVEFAAELAQLHGRDQRVTDLLDRVRVVVVPVVNPDGYAVSRDLEVEGKRRSCRVDDAREEVTRAECADAANADFGVDLNRNYGVNWGGSGSSGVRTQEDYRGTGPFSEPETRNVRDLVSTHQVTGLVSVHTYAALTVRPPYQRATSATADEPLYARVGEVMAAANGYPSVPGGDLYEAAGTAVEWAYHTTGGLGFDVELGGDSSHDPFPTAVVGPYAGFRESVLVAVEAAADPANHAVLTGTAPEGAVLTARKSFDQTTGRDGTAFTSDLTSTATAHGAFTWHVNPSVRPAFDGGTHDEAWTVTCARPHGEVLQETRVTAGRGTTTGVDLGECAADW
ncbi:M14 family zinc carboxypeptidase [Actinosynnema sp. NPDC050801]|uniref:M14 family zinc carboxypeptidase n=1 Tax=unclassified Actinosynnema TaxID=2637065 RepID=UPI0033D51503